MSRQALMPNAENCSLEELETALQAASSLRSHRRMLAMKMLLTGFTHDQVAPLFSCDQRTLRRWVKRFNQAGIDGLLDAPKPGRPRKIPPEQKSSLVEIVQHPEKAGETHWTGHKFHGFLRDSLELEVGYRTVIRWLHEQGFALKVPRPWPDRQDEAQRQAYLEWLRGVLADESVELWYLDETGIEGDPRPRRRWAQKGEKTRVTKNGDHVRMNVTGMICPRTGEFYALQFTHSDGDVFQAFLDHANRDTQKVRPRNLLICDNASWHKNKGLDWGDFEPVYLPPYSPDFNPIERLWLVLKGEWFTDFIAKGHEQLIDRIDKALLWVINRTEGNQQTCAIRT